MHVHFLLSFAGVAEGLNTGHPCVARAAGSSCACGKPGRAAAAMQAVLDNREALLGVLGPELAAEVAELRLVKREPDFCGEEPYFWEESDFVLRREADGRVVFLGHRESADMWAAPLRTAATAMRERLWRVITTLAPPPLEWSSIIFEC